MIVIFHVLTYLPLFLFNNNIVNFPCLAQFPPMYVDAKRLHI